MARKPKPVAIYDVVEVEGSLMERTDMVLSREDLMDLVTDCLAAGGSLSTFCDNLQIRYSDLMRHITRDPARKERYGQAVIAREERAQERLLHEVDVMATADLTHILDKEFNVLPTHEWPPEFGKAVEAIIVNEKPNGDREVKVKLWNKPKMIELYGKQLKMFTDKLQIEAGGSLQDLVEKSYQFSKEKENAQRDVHSEAGRSNGASAEGLPEGNPVGENGEDTENGITGKETNAMGAVDGKSSGNKRENVTNEEKVPGGGGGSGAREEEPGEQASKAPSEVS